MIVAKVSSGELVHVFESFRKQPYSIFLDSGLSLEGLGRFSLIASDPFLVFKSKGEQISVLENGLWKTKRGDPFQALRLLMKRYRAESDPRVPLTAGAFGYFAYDLNRLIEGIPPLAKDDLGLPDCYLGFYDRLVIHDHRTGKSYLTSTGLPEQGRQAEIRAEQRLQELQQILCREQENSPVPGIIFPNNSGRGSNEPGGLTQIYGHFTDDSYYDAVKQVQKYIDLGEISEAILSQRFSCKLTECPWQLYLELRRINPAPFAAYLHYPELDLACASPERLVKVENRRVESRPIKGTRPRGKNTAEDLLLQEELLQSEKDRAELALITELGCNELRRICSDDSVEVVEQFGLEKHPTVFHLVSTVRGKLAPDKDLVDLLLATFPGASISGAPKKRAMEIIEQLEPVKRGIYTGSIGYLGFNGAADLNTVIRTFIIKDNRAYFQVGGGIIDRSEPEAEFQETMTKARALLEALGYREGVKICQELPG